MTESDPRDPAYVEHMLEAIARIRRYVGRKRRAGFLGDALLQDAVIRNIEIVGEAASRLSPEFAARHAEIPWRDIVGMRHRLIHGYLNVNLVTVWEVIERDLPALAPRLRALLGAPSAEVHEALFAKGKPKQRAPISVKEGIRKHMREKHARR